MDAHFAGVCGRTGLGIGEGDLPGWEVMRSEYDPTEEVTATRWHKSPRSRRATTERDGIVREVIYNLVEEFLRETRGSGEIGRWLGSESARVGHGRTHMLAGLSGNGG